MSENEKEFVPSGHLLCKSVASQELLTVCDFYTSNKKHFVFTGSCDAKLALWKWDECLLMPVDCLDCHEDGIIGCDVNPDISTFATVSPATVALFNYDGDLSYKTFERKPRELSAAALSPNGVHLVVGSRTGSVSILNVASMDVCAFVGLPCRSSVRAVAYAPDGERIAVGCGDGSVYLVDSQRLSVLTSLHPHSDRIWALKFSPDGSLLFSSSRDSTIKVHDAGKQPHSICTFDGHTCQVTSLALSRNGRWLVSGSFDGLVCLWDVEERRSICKLLEQDAPISAVALTHEEPNLLMSSSEMGVLMVYDFDKLVRHGISA
uniref:WD_REPEATS_REGION domain-containing protein n=1 Tax=Trichuris muris TaxID=70415 RepID=A0A5S6QIZ4_TRIMR